MSLNPTDLKRLKDAFSEHASNSPAPDAVALWNRSLKQLAEDVRNETEAGQRMLSILENGVNREGIDKVVERLTKKSPTP